MPLVYDDGSPIVLTASNGTPIRARLYAYNSAGTSLRTADIVLTPSTGALVTSVTGSSAPLHVSQALLIDGVSYDVQVVSHFAGQPDELTAAVLATYTAPATPTVGALRYTPPTMTNPIIINVPTTGGSYDYLAQLDRDIILNLPSSPVTGSVECKGGRNWRVIGGHFSSNRWLKNISGERAACMDINRWTGTFHIEGVVFDPFNQGLSFDPTVNVDTLPAHYHDNITSWSGSATSILVVQNCWGRVAHMHDPESANKGDLLQTYRGPSAVRVHRYTGRSNGQGMFMWSTNLSGYPTFQEHQFKDINLIRQAAPNNGGGAMYGLWPETIPVTVENCYVQKAAGSNTGEASGSGADLWTRSTSPRPEGDIVHPSTIGLGYPQPGETGHPGVRGMSAVGIPTTLSTDTIVVDLPDGLAAGDPFQVLIAHYGGTTTVTVPSGATLLSPPGLMTDGTNNSRGYLYSVVCPDPVPESMTWTLGAVRNAIGVAWVEDNQSTAPTTVAHATGSATVSGPNPPAITPASGGMRIVACGFHNRGYITTVPTGWQELFSVSAGGTTSSSVGAWAAVIDGPPTSTVVDPGIASFPGTTANWAATTMAITVGDPAPITPAPATGVTVSTGFLVDFTEPAGSIGHTVRVYPAGTAPAGT